MQYLNNQKSSLTHNLHDALKILSYLSTVGFLFGNIAIGFDHDHAVLTNTIYFNILYHSRQANIIWAQSALYSCSGKKYRSKSIFESFWGHEGYKTKLHLDQGIIKVTYKRTLEPYIFGKVTLYACPYRPFRKIVTV